jgi:hypothetical protein
MHAPGMSNHEAMRADQGTLKNGGKDNGLMHHNALAQFKNELHR